MADPFSFLVESPSRLDLFLSRVTGQSRQFTQFQIKKGRIRCNDSVVMKPAHALKAGDQVTGHFEERPATDVAPVQRELDILYEDDSLIALNKPQDMVVHPAAGHRGPTLVNYLLHHLQSSPDFQQMPALRPGIVHRLDRGTSGVIVVAKNRSALEALALQFKSREVKKEYEAIAWGKMRLGGRFESAVGRDKRDRKKMSSKTEKGRVAMTRWESTEGFRHFTLVSLFPHTGRTHQLRVHLSEGGHPIVGDSLYGKRSMQRRRGDEIAESIQDFVARSEHPFLHARKLELRHPVSGALLVLEAPRPELFNDFVELLRAEDR